MPVRDNGSVIVNAYANGNANVNADAIVCDDNANANANANTNANAHTSAEIGNMLTMIATSLRRWQNMPFHQILNMSKSCTSDS